MRERRAREVKAIIIFSLSLIILASLISYNENDLPFRTSHPNRPPKNLIGIFGAYLAESVFFLFGRAGFLLPFYLFILGIKKFKGQIWKSYSSKIIGIIGLFLCLSSLFSLFGDPQISSRFFRGGFFGLIISNFLTKYFRFLGATILILMFGSLFLSLVSESMLINVFMNAAEKIKRFKFRKIPKLALLKLKEKKQRVSLEVSPPKITERDKLISQKIKEKKELNFLERKKKKIEKFEEKTTEKKIGEYQIPPIDLLESPPPIETRLIKNDLTLNAKILEETLSDFGISVKITDIERGPVITRYELEPAPGLKVHRIASLSDDIALAMKAQSVRIVAPIPGKARVGVEVPNTKISLVYLKDVIGSKEFQGSNSKLTLGLGKDISGNPVIADLCEMPHLLICGTTGSGKTVCVNCLITSILYKSTPGDVKFLMIDPKMVELIPFNGLPHLLAPVLTEAKKVRCALNWLLNEMEERYKLFAKETVRNIEAYNEKRERLPYIMVIIDELADLMAVAKDQIENAIIRLAQLSRAVGIHLVLATQRPSVDVVTGVVKANFPARVSFKVASKVDSRTVLDIGGADKLLGKGDMLFLKPGESRPIRAQGSLISDLEIERIVKFISFQSSPVYEEELLKEESKTLFYLEKEKDELFSEAVRVILETGQASVSILQRRLHLGYTRAARLIDSLEQEGMIGPYCGSRPRKILIKKEEWSKLNKS